MKQKLGAPSDQDVDMIKQENLDLQRQIESMEKKIEDVTNEVRALFVILTDPKRKRTVRET